MVKIPSDAPEVPERACDYMRCRHFASTLIGERCVQRQIQVWVSRASGTSHPAHLHCGSGKCEQGKRVLEAVGAEVVRPPDLKTKGTAIPPSRSRQVVAVAPAPEPMAADGKG